ncbi:MAG: hypothetical protein EHM25_02700 [Nitrosopumilales archaeon]|nr:MAG: hypothetical protein EHM25_12480 [Nitrosopumilales archaeon]RPJ31563.1 MAG: hypothetical protein EHM25_02700 [Nitrosopumilales archaeon]
MKHAHEYDMKVVIAECKECQEDFVSGEIYSPDEELYCKDCILTYLVDNGQLEKITLPCI